MLSPDARDEADGPGQDRDYVASLAKGLAVIRAFDRQSAAMTLSDVARRTGLTRAAARRFLLTLERLGYVRSDGRQFGLTAKVLDLGFAYLGSLELPEVAIPFMEEVVRQVQESCSASVLDGEDIVYVARIPTSRIMSVSLGVGTRLPAYCTSMGRVLLGSLRPELLDDYLSEARLEPLTEHTVTDRAQLQALIVEARCQSYALVDQELELGLRSIAVPARNKRGAVIAAINVSAHASRCTKRDMTRRMLPPLQACAAQIQPLLP